MDWWCLGAVLYEMMYGLVSNIHMNLTRVYCKPDFHFYFVFTVGSNSFLLVLPQPPFYSRNTAEMYDNILNKPLQLKPNISNAARHLLEGLLQKDRNQRLGCTEDFVSVRSLDCVPLSGKCVCTLRMC